MPESGVLLSEGKFAGIKPINVSKEDLEELREFMKSPKASDWLKDNRMKKLVGSWCTICGSIPTKIASYDYNGATRIERYCDSCAVKQFSRLDLRDLSSLVLCPCVS